MIKTLRRKKSFTKRTFFVFSFSTGFCKKKKCSPKNINIGGIYSFTVIKVAYGVEKKKVDGQGRFLLPYDWRMEELKENKEVFVIKGKGYLKIVPKRKVDLTKFFDTADLGRNIEDWALFSGQCQDC